MSSDSFEFYFKILDSISSKLKPLVSGTMTTTNKRDTKAIAPKRRKRFSAPSSSYRMDRYWCNNSTTSREKCQSWAIRSKEKTTDLKGKGVTEIKFRTPTFNGENAKVTMALEPKLVRTARLIPLPLVRSGKISETISQLIGPNDIWDFENKIIRTNLTFFLWTVSYGGWDGYVLVSSFSSFPSFERSCRIMATASYAIFY